MYKNAFIGVIAWEFGLLKNNNNNNNNNNNIPVHRIM